MRKLSTEKRTMILRALVEGNSINATTRLCGCSKITVLRLPADAGTFCAQWHDRHRSLGFHPIRVLRNVSVVG